MTDGDLAGNSRAKLVAYAAICAALYATVNAITSFIPTPFGIGEFRPGVIVPAFFAVVAGPIPAAIGAGIGSFIGDMVSLVPAGRSTFALALGAGATGNFVGFLLLGYVYQKLRTWKGFILGTTSGLFLGNFVAAAGVVLIAGLPFNPYLPGFLLFWFGTMFPFVIIFVPILVRMMRPYASQLSSGGIYPEITEPNRKLMWIWSIIVAALLIAALFAGLLSESKFISTNGGAIAWEALFVASAVAVIAVGAFLPQISKRRAVNATLHG
ncbi:MAG: ECF transporter S component [Nitrososphaerales archaeon]